MSEIDFINVGYGDSILLQSIDQRALIDCGDMRIRVNPEKGERIVASDYLIQQGIDAIDLLWITHLHLDHVGGLDAMPHKIGIKRIVTPYIPDKQLINRIAPIPEGAPDGVVCLIKALNIYTQALKFYLLNGAEVLYCSPLTKKIDPIQIGECVLEPFYQNNREGFFFMKKCFDDALMGCPNVNNLLLLDETINNYSIGLHIKNNQTLIELPGDMGLDSCKMYLDKACEIFKMPHHGHKNSIDDELMQRIRPNHTVISVSNDRLDPCPYVPVIQTALAFGDVSFTDAVTYEGTTIYHNSVHFSI